MRIMKCRAGHVFLTPTDGPNQFQKPHVDCGAPIDSATAEIKDMSQVFNCRICNAPEVAGYLDHIAKELRDQQLCFDCHFWQEKIKWRQEENLDCFVINGNHYKVDIDEDPKNRRFSGFGGSRFHIRRLPPFAVALRFEGSKFKTDIITHNLWHQGTVPDRFRDVLCDNAEFIKDEQ